MAPQAVLRALTAPSDRVVSEMVSAERHVANGHLDREVGCCLTSWVIFYGLACWDCRSVEDFFLTRSEADDCLRRVLEDEPEWTDVVGLVRLDFSGPEPVVDILAPRNAA